jgi:hypothetical protein
MRKDIKSEDGRPFEKGNQAAKGKGRPKSVRGLIDRLCIDEGVEKLTRTNRDELYTTLVVLPVKRLTELANDDKQPAIVRIVAKAILSGKGFEVIQQVNNTSLGDPNKQDVIITFNRIFTDESDE